MDNTYKTHYQSGFFTNKKKYNTRIKTRFREKLGLQIAICLLILMLAGIIKCADTEVTNSLNDNIKKALSTDMDVSSISAPLMSWIKGVYGEGDKSTASADIIDQIPENPTQGSSNADKGTDVTKQQDNAVSKDTVISTPVPSSTVKYKGIFITPASGTLGAVFGDTTDQLTQKVKSHKGADIEAPNGTEIKAAADGIVLESAFEKTMGYYIKIEHSNGYSTIYSQCSQLIAQKGQNVKQGDVIAKVGSTGVASGSHLHFEIWKDGKAVNPQDYIRIPEK